MGVSDFSVKAFFASSEKRVVVKEAEVARVRGARIRNVCSTLYLQSTGLFV